MCKITCFLRIQKRNTDRKYKQTHLSRNSPLARLVVLSAFIMTVPSSWMDTSPEANAVDSLTKLQSLVMRFFWMRNRKAHLTFPLKFGIQQPVNKAESKVKGMSITYLVGSCSLKKFQRLVGNIREMHQHSTCICHSLEKVLTGIIVRRQPKKSGTIGIVIDPRNLTCKDGRIWAWQPRTAYVSEAR